MAITNDRVEIEVHVIYKILQHFMDVPTVNVSSSTGALLGLLNDGVVNVTECYPFPTSNSINYNADMMSLFGKEERDEIVVGLYTSIILDSFVSEDFLLKLYMYQSSFSQCVMLVFDYVKMLEGVFCVKAYRLDHSFSALLSTKNFSLDNCQGLSYRDMLLELPTVVYFSPLSKILFKKLQINANLPLDYVGTDRFPLLDENLYFVFRAIKDLLHALQDMHTRGRELEARHTATETADTLENEENELYSNAEFPSKAGEEPLDSLSIDQFNYLIGRWNLDFLKGEAGATVDSISGVSNALQELFSVSENFLS